MEYICLINMIFIFWAEQSFRLWFRCEWRKYPWNDHLIYSSIELANKSELELPKLPFTKRVFISSIQWWRTFSLSWRGVEGKARSKKRRSLMIHKKTNAGIFHNRLQEREKLQKMSLHCFENKENSTDIIY